MIILPAIDVLDQKPVRLYQGDYSTSHQVAEDVLETAKAFEEAGAGWLHMVDLNGAREKKPVNFNKIKEVKDNTSLKIEIGGGIRDMETARSYIDLGVDRIILGSAAVKDRNFLKEALGAFAGKVAVGIDALNDEVKVEGWTEETGINLYDFLNEVENLGCETVIVTDISKDGAMEGTNLDLYRNLQEKTSMDIVASGGVSSISDLEILSAYGLYGAIIGKAIYNKAIDLREAIKVGRRV